MSRDDSLASKTALFVRRLVSVFFVGAGFLSLLLLVYIVFLGVLFRVGELPLRQFPASVDVPIGPDGYSVVRIDPGNVICENVRIVSADGLALLEAEFGSTESCEPRNWSLYVAHPSNDSVHVELDLTGYLPREESSPEIAFGAPSRFPLSEMVSVAIEAESADSLIAVDSSTPWRTHDAHLWTGTPHINLGCLASRDDRTAFVLVNVPISGVLSVLNVGPSAPRPEIAVRRPTAVLSETISGDKAATDWLYVEVEIIDGIDPSQVALVIEGSATTRGRDPKTSQQRASAWCSHSSPGYDPLTGSFGGDTRFAIANCDNHHCDSVRLSMPSVPSDWEVTLHWVFFDNEVTPQLPLVVVEGIDAIESRSN